MARSRKSIRPNQIFAIITTSLVLFLSGLFGVLVLQGNQLLNQLKESIIFVVEMNPSAEQKEQQQVVDFLGQHRMVMTNTIVLQSKEEIAKEMEIEMGTLLSKELPNPFFDLITFNIKGEYLHKEQMNTLRDDLLNTGEINAVYYEQLLAGRLLENIERLSFFAGISGLVLMFLVAILMHNTIRLSLYANRFIIRNMELVGASQNFISRPFIIQAIVMGTVAGLLAIGAIGGIIYWFENELQGIFTERMMEQLWFMLGILPVMGIFVSVISTKLVVHKYLKMRMDDLY
jgi:cell division transport system permease protein